jgi:X-X-X-Leu-X-X-Gly heptad repeat protein
MYSYFHKALCGSASAPKGPYTPKVCASKAVRSARALPSERWISRSRALHRSTATRVLPTVFACCACWSSKSRSGTSSGAPGGIDDVAIFAGALVDAFDAFFAGAAVELAAGAAELAAGAAELTAGAAEIAAGAAELAGAAVELASAAVELAGAAVERAAPVDAFIPHTGRSRGDIGIHIGMSMRTPMGKCIHIASPSG